MNMKEVKAKHNVQTDSNTPENWHSDPDFWENLWNVVATQIEQNPKNTTVLQDLQDHSLDTTDDLT